MGNYNSSQVGVPYIRVNKLEIEYPATGIVSVKLSQSSAVKLADNSITEILPLAQISFELDMNVNGATPIPLVDPTTGAGLGASTDLNHIMIGILAAIRQQQVLQNP